MSKYIKRKSQKQETNIAKDLNGKVTLVSGAFYFQKADVRTDDYLIEAKFTDKDFYSLNIKIWDKIRLEALKDGLRTPLMQVNICGDKHSFAIMDINDFEGTFIENNKYTFTLYDVIETDKKSFRIKGDIIEYTTKVNEIPYTNLKVGKFDLVVLLWSDFLLIQN